MAVPAPHLGKAGCERVLDRYLERWQRVVNERRAVGLTLEQVLVGRTFTEVRHSLGNWTIEFVLPNDGGSVVVEPTRGWLGATFQEEPGEGPFTVRRVLANHRTFRMEDNRSLVISKKVQLIKTRIPQIILDELVPNNE
jgi:hypothetical protein